jgi:hypothetical protein
MQDTEFNLSPTQTKFNVLAICLRQAGYAVATKDGQEYSIATISGQGIRGGFAMSHWNEIGHQDVSHHIWNGIAFDRADKFDKYSTCACTLSFPETTECFDFVLEQMRRLRSRTSQN